MVAWKSLGTIFRCSKKNLYARQRASESVSNGVIYSSIYFAALYALAFQGIVYCIFRHEFKMQV